jgi:hypothetical protein
VILVVQFIGELVILAWLIALLVDQYGAINPKYSNETTEGHIWVSDPKEPLHLVH